MLLFSRRTATFAAGLLLPPVLLAGCTAAGQPAAPAATSTPAPIPRAQVTVRPTPTPTPVPSASPIPSRPTAPRTVVDAGTVTNTTQRTATGSGAAEIRFREKGGFAIVVRLDCSRCRGPYLLTEAGRGTPHGEGRAPAERAYLIRQLVASQRGALLLTATGDWKITLLSWNELKPTSGRESGRGSDVVYLSDLGAGFRVNCRPADAADSCHVQAYNAAGDSRLVGDDNSLTEDVGVALPAVVAIRTNGRWTLTPLR